MASTPDPRVVLGAWEPYYSTMVPGLWLNEGGWSAAGAAIDHLVTLHPAATARAEGLSLVEWLDRETLRMSGGPEQVVRLADGVHVVPEFLGNRSTFANPDARAVIAGLGLDRDMASLVRLYVAGLCGIGYGFRQLLDRLEVDGVAIATIMARGGAA